MITTLCYMKRDGKMLLLYRNKKKNDVNAGKWIGVGGKLERGESPHEGVKREILEETGYVANHCDFRGIVVFCYNDNPPEYMHLYTCTNFSG
ncbi:NUDIX domain-containing protein, partial [Bacillus licheniformis]|uniref:NUDIX hydrolase n=1 Tax=Bacillus licheniformis TaxID=1402 RepID=UPI000F5DEFD8